MRYFLLTVAITVFAIWAVFHSMNKNTNTDFTGTLTGQTPHNELTDEELRQAEMYGTEWYTVTGKTAAGNDTTFHVKSGAIHPKYVVKGKTAYVKYYQSFSEIVDVK